MGNHMARNNYIYVDYENVHKVELGRLAGKAAHVTLVVGPQQKALPLPMVALMIEHVSKVALVESELAGRNALDFVLACEVGRKAERDPQGYFHIISRDKGFDAVIRHLKGRKILAARRESFSEVPVLMNCSERVEILAGRYRDKIGSLPGQRKSLESSILAIFGKGLSAKELNDTIQGLVTKEVIEIGQDDCVNYPALVG